MALRISNDAASKGVDAAVGDRLDNGYLRIYNGTIPGTANTAVSTQVMLAELRWSTAAFASAVDGVIITSGLTASAVATGSATWFRVLQSDASSVICDGSVGTAGSDMNLNSITFTSGVLVEMHSATFTLLKT